MKKEEVLSKLRKAAEAYYNNEDLTISDEEYDKLSEYAESKGWLTQDSMINDGAKIENLTIEHKVPMLSLQKAKTEKEIAKYFDFVRKQDDSVNFILEPKLDGLALSVIYDKDGNIHQMVTRGDGQFGENISYLIGHKEVIIKNIKNKVFGCSELRGELICTKEDFNKTNENRGEPFKNNRIASAGIVKKAQKGLGYRAYLTFVAYSAYSGNEEVNIPDDVSKARDLFPENHSSTLRELMENIDKAKSNLDRSLHNIPTDGVVIKPNKILKGIESTSHHPRTQIAWKYPGATKISKVLDVVFQVGKTGRLTPVAIIEPVVIDNVEIKNITLHNLSWIKEMNIKIGSIVEVTRANDVIPAIKRVLVNGGVETKEILTPEKCPVCGSDVIEDGKYIKCSNKGCEAIVKNRLESYVGRSLLDIEGMNTAVIEALNISSLYDLLSVNLETLENLKYGSDVSLGKARAKIIYDNIQKAKHSTKEHIWLACLDIPNLSTQTAKTLLRVFGSIDRFFSATEQELSKIVGLGPVMIQNIKDNRFSAKEKWEQLKTIITIKENGGIIGNKGSFCVTGKIHPNFKNRDEFVKYMENKGYSFHSSVRYGTDYLITMNPEENSSKLQKARKLGVKITSFEDFI